MTTKRFSETWSTMTVTDHKTGREYKCEMRIDDELLKLLNELAEENEQLKKEINKLKSVNELLSMDFANSEHELWKENEELKQQKQQYKGQRDYLLFVIERTCSKELFEETKSYLKEVE